MMFASRYPSREPKRSPAHVAFPRTVAGAGLGIAVFLATLTIVSFIRPVSKSKAIGLDPHAAHLRDPVAAAQQSAQASPGDPRVWATLGIVYVGKARTTADPSWYPLAERALQRSLTIKAVGNADAMIGMSVLASARHAFTRALDYAKSAKAAGGDQISVDAILGDALVELGRYREGFDAFDRMMEAKPRLAAYARVSYARELQGDVLGAIQAMELALKAAGSEEDAAFAATQLAELHWNAGRLSVARHYYALALKYQPSLVAARVGLAKIAAASGNFSDAISRYEKIVDTVPMPEHVAALHDLYVVAGRPGKAAETLALIDVQRRLLTANGVNIDAESAIIAADYHRGLPATLRSVRAEWQKRKSIVVADALAWALFASNKPVEALTYANQAVRLGTRHALLYFHKAMIEQTLGDAVAASRDFSAALRINPAFSVRWSAVARAALKGR